MVAAAAALTGFEMEASANRAAQTAPPGGIAGVTSIARARPRASNGPARSCAEDADGARRAPALNAFPRTVNVGAHGDFGRAVPGVDLQLVDGIETAR